MYFDGLWRAFSKMEEVVAVALGGSRAGGNSDPQSDYDLYIYCSRVPAESTRRQVLEKFCSRTEISNQFWELEDDCTLKDGTDIDILYRNLEQFTDEVASVAERYNARNGYTTCLWHNLLNSRILYDRDGKFAALQKRFTIPYPEELKRNIISRNMRLLTGNLPSYDGQIKKALRRGDNVSVNHRTAAFLESYFDIIFAVNGLTHPGEKRMAAYAKAHAGILPAGFEENLDTLLRSLYSDPDKAAETLEKMTAEIKRICTQD